jgi:hypothetical protein
VLEISAIVWGMRDLHRSIRFWSDALISKLRRVPDIDFANFNSNEGEGEHLSLNAAVTSGNPNRHRMDLFTGDQAKEVARLLTILPLGWSGSMRLMQIMLC